MKYIIDEKINNDIDYLLYQTHTNINTYKIYKNGKFIYCENFKKINGKDVFGN